MFTCKTRLCPSQRDCKPSSKTCFISYAHYCSNFSDNGTCLLFLRSLVALFTSLPTASRSVPHTYRSEFIWRALEHQEVLRRLSVSFPIQTDLVSQASSYYGSSRGPVAVWRIILGQYLTVIPTVVKSACNEDDYPFGELFQFSPHKKSHALFTESSLPDMRILLPQLRSASQQGHSDFLSITTPTWIFLFNKCAPNVKLFFYRHLVPMLRMYEDPLICWLA